MGCFRLMRVAALLLLAFTLSAAAEERSGPFLSAGYGVMKFSDDGYFRYQGYARESIGSGFRAAAGFYIDRHLSVALEYNDLGRYKGSDGAGGTLEESFSSVGLVVTAHYPLIWDDLEGFVRFGACELGWNETGDTHDSDQAASLLAGLGIAYRYSETLALTVDYTDHAFKLVEGSKNFSWRVDSVTLGVEVQF